MKKQLYNISRTAEITIKLTIAWLINSFEPGCTFLHIVLFESFLKMGCIGRPVDENNKIFMVMKEKGNTAILYFVLLAKF